MALLNYFFKSDEDYKILQEKYNKNRFDSRTQQLQQTKELQEQIINKDKQIEKFNNTTIAIKDLLDRIELDDQRIKKEKNELELIFENTNDAVIILDSDFFVKRINKKAEKLLENYKYSDIIGTEIYDLFPSLKDINLNDFEKEICVVANNQYQMKIQKLYNKNEKLIYINFINDITEYQYMQEQLEKFKQAYMYLKSMIKKGENNETIIEELKSVLKIQEKYYNGYY